MQSMRMENLFCYNVSGLGFRQPSASFYFTESDSLDGRSPLLAMEKTTPTSNGGYEIQQAFQRDDLILKDGVTKILIKLKHLSWYWVDASSIPAEVSRSSEILAYAPSTEIGWYKAELYHGYTNDLIEKVRNEQALHWAHLAHLPKSGGIFSGLAQLLRIRTP